MELGQLLQNLLGNSGGAKSAAPDALPVRVLNDLTRVVNAESAKVLMGVLQQSVQQQVGQQLSRLPIMAVKVTVQPANAAKQQPPQVLLQLTVQGKNVVVPVAITRTQQQQIQQLQQQAPQQPMLVIAKSVSKPAAQESKPQLNLQLVSLKAPKQPVEIKLPLAQLPRPAADALLQSVTQQRLPQQTPTQQSGTQAPLISPRAAQTAAAAEGTLPTASATPKTAAPTAPPPATPGVLLKQASQTTPNQLQQALQSLIREALIPRGTAEPTPREAPTPRGTAEPTPREAPIPRGTAEPTPREAPSPRQALASVLQAVLQQLPKGEAMQQPQQLKQWVNDWFAAKPVATAPQQQMGTLGKMLMMLLGMALQKPAAAASQSAAPLSGSQQQSVSQLTQALIDEVMRPAPRSAGDTGFTGEVRERINQLLQQLPQTQLQRLMQLFTSAVNSAQTSQARLAETSAATPEYYVLLPANAQQPEQQHELLIRREQERGSDGEQGRTLWLFTLRFELKSYGPLLVKGRYHPAGTRVDFYTESDHAQRALETKLEKLTKRFEQLEVNGLNLTVQKGRVPGTLAKQQSGIIRVTV
ncbi:MAG: flagellar hook-length control protein FliK [Idiomarina sp.]|uniref:flagellar hook-length control protein FliK n=1 Tax=Idiomarina sp. TaxID=1874361 RepID=UPI000C4C13DD|nr:flagellar hook-length control protein FliK [Idiomarina sp.]MBT41255.1 flagellar hook-length control protein FliK [Idiomarina sp.]